VKGSHDIHSLWFDTTTGWLMAAGLKHVEALDVTGGTPVFVKEWDLSGLIPEDPYSQLGHIDQLSSDEFGNLFVAVNSGQIIYLDLNVASYTPTLLTNVGAGLDDLVAGHTPIPEPSTLVLSGLGLLGASLLLKKRH